jgi:hypothetical protein
MSKNLKKLTRKIKKKEKNIVLNWIKKIHNAIIPKSSMTQILLLEIKTNMKMRKVMILIISSKNIKFTAI